MAAWKDKETIKKIEEFVNFHFEVNDNPSGKYVYSTDFESIKKLLESLRNYLKD